MKAVILAAGEGTRLNNGWTIVPKPLLDVGGRTIIERAILELKKAGIQEFVVVVGFMSEHIKDFLRDGTDLGVHISYTYNADYRKDMIYSVLAAKKHVNEPFILCMADLLFDSSIIKDLLKVHQESLSPNTSYITVDHKLHEVRRAEEKVRVKAQGNKVLHCGPSLLDHNSIDCGIYLLNPSFFSTIKREIETKQENVSLHQALSITAQQERMLTHNIGSSQIIDIDREKDVKHAIEVLRQPN